MSDQPPTDDEAERLMLDLGPVMRLDELCSSMRIARTTMQGFTRVVVGTLGKIGTKIDNLEGERFAAVVEHLQRNIQLVSVFVDDLIAYLRAKRHSSGEYPNSNPPAFLPDEEEAHRLMLDASPLERAQLLYEDMRVPIGSVKGWTQVLLKEFESFRHKLDEEKANWLHVDIQTIHDSAEQMLRLLNDARAYARRKAQEAQSSDDSTKKGASSR